MDMESRGPGDYDASAIAENLAGVEFLVVHKAPVSRTVFESTATTWKSSLRPEAAPKTSTSKRPPTTA